MKLKHNRLIIKIAQTSPRWNRNQNAAQSKQEFCEITGGTKVGISGWGLIPHQDMSIFLQFSETSFVTGLSFSATSSPSCLSLSPPKYTHTHFCQS